MTEPVETPPVETPPVETPPVETPPVETPPVETPSARGPLDEVPEDVPEEVGDEVPAGSGSTGHDGVDAALREMSDAAHLPPGAQIEAYEAVHSTLQETLRGIEQV